MAKTFKVEVVTPEATALSAMASALQAPSWEGYLGVLAGHAPLLCVLRPGVLTVRDEAGKPRFFALKGGFMDVGPERVMVLADAIEPAEEIDRAAAEKALDEAMKPLPPLAPAAAAPAREAARIARALAEEAREEAHRWAEARIRAAERREEAA